MNTAIDYDKVWQLTAQLESTVEFLQRIKRETCNFSHRYIWLAMTDSDIKTMLTYTK